MYELTERGVRVAKLMGVFVENNFVGMTRSDRVARALAQKGLKGGDLAAAVGCGLLIPRTWVVKTIPLPGELEELVDKYAAETPYRELQQSKTETTMTGAQFKSMTDLSYLLNTKTTPFIDKKALRDMFGGEPNANGKVVSTPEKTKRLVEEKERRMIQEPAALSFIDWAIE